MSSTLTSVVGTSEWLSRLPEQDGFAEYVPAVNGTGRLLSHHPLLRRAHRLCPRCCHRHRHRIHSRGGRRLRWRNRLPRHQPLSHRTITQHRTIFLVRVHHHVPMHVRSAERRVGTRPVRWSGAPTAVDLVVASFDAPLRLARDPAWLAPWHQASVSGELAGPLPGLSPASAHLVEQVGVVLLLAAGALLSRQWRRRRLVAGEIAACLRAPTGLRRGELGFPTLRQAIRQRPRLDDRHLGLLETRTRPPVCGLCPRSAWGSFGRTGP